MIPWLTLAIAVVLLLVLVRQARIRRFSRVAPGFYRGGQPQLLGLWYLARVKKIKTIVNLRADAIALNESRFGMREIRLPLPTGTNVPTLEQVEEFLRLVDDPANRPLMVHCKVGADRTGFMVAMWRILREGASCDQALAEIERVKGKPTTELHKQLLAEFAAALKPPA